MQCIHRATVNAFLILTQFGFCSVYFVFMGDNLHQVNICCVFCQLWSIPPVKVFTACGADLSTQVWIVILIPLIVIFCWIRNLDSLAPLATVANICIIFGLAVILYDCFYLVGEHKAAVNTVGVDAVMLGGSAIPLFFGNAVYAFEGIGVVITYTYNTPLKGHTEFKIAILILHTFTVVCPFCFGSSVDYIIMFVC